VVQDQIHAPNMEAWCVLLTFAPLQEFGITADYQWANVSFGGENKKVSLKFNCALFCFITRRKRPRRTFFSEEIRTHRYLLQK